MKQQNELLTQTSFAKLIGISQQMVSRYIAEGKLTTVGKKLKMPEAYNDYQNIKNGSTSTGKPNSATSLYQKARAAKTSYQAKLVEMELQGRKGELISVEEACREITSAGITIRAKFLALPDKVAHQLEGLDCNEIRKVLDDEINECLEDLYSLSQDYKKRMTEYENVSKQVDEEMKK